MAKCLLKKGCKDVSFKKYVFIFVEDPYIYAINCSSPVVKEKGGGSLTQVAKCIGTGKREYLKCF